MMLVESDESCIYFEARPKREERPNVYKVILEIMGIFTVLYDGKANCIMHPEENSRGMWTVMMKFESDEYKNLLAQDKRFQELITDLRAYCKPDCQLIVVENFIRSCTPANISVLSYLIR
jgi:hypothetical protein